MTTKQSDVSRIAQDFAKQLMHHRDTVEQMGGTLTEDDAALFFRCCIQSYIVHDLTRSIANANEVISQMEHNNKNRSNHE
jgi:rubrerythrin